MFGGVGLLIRLAAQSKGKSQLVKGNYSWSPCNVWFFASDELAVIKLEKESARASMSQR